MASAKTGKTKTGTLVALGLFFSLGVVLFVQLTNRPIVPLQQPLSMPPQVTLLTDPFLQSPTESSIRVVWFTEFAGSDHKVMYGPGDQTVFADTTQLSRTREDAESKTVEPYEAVTQRPIWRHEAEISGLRPGLPVPYAVASTTDDGTTVQSDQFSLRALPPAGEPLKILLTSDHQLMPMTAANLQKVEETIGQVDGVFLAGDLVNIPDRASEWFDDARGGAFFPCLQGRASYNLINDENEEGTVYKGGKIIQNAPLFTAVGNHEVMGRYSTTTALNKQFNDPVPWNAAKDLYDQHKAIFNPTENEAVERHWLKENSFNIDTYNEIFSLPKAQRDNGQTQRYYATTFGDVRLVSLYVTQIWRMFKVDDETRGRYQERAVDLGNPQNWGHGQMIFESIEPGSPQYEWLQAELASDEFQQAKYKIVMLHHPAHTLGDNVVPAFTTPVPVYDYGDEGNLTGIRYEYPKEEDHIIKYLVPLLDEAGTDLVFYGHSHIWNRFKGDSGMHFLESSNVGNTYHAHTEARPRPVPQDSRFKETYVATGDPNGLTPIMPTLKPLTDEFDNPMPYIASNDITAFSILDTGLGTITSYYFDTRKPESAVIPFDVFNLGQRER
ncbi:metallophosphoesterase family protein [Leptolyngbyaceae cyanobacterium CCMR0082]|uniref:Metallophosphoesterase family protein n=2 Tax=Adonisia turfae TaxID=2950184 RepID=A0A6M0S1H9_9CYAN|nr:metallophosphoesterase family protein [Adonisia turfae]MDV3349066.1 metallophosphoesterase family protein [Leptothoe sp. LEGE 181152]NEZ59431.1 metallophosphoesterase family protein [Adonisia turfae CCMR0081]NEZ62090.1 metallophosphoesterase family protein [Adonisia turfae CCMR0082]